MYLHVFSIHSVASIPCHSASFGRTEVHKPRDEKIDFWIDFNFRSKCISLFVEEKDQEGNYKEGSSWETVIIKAENVEDYRLKGINNGDFALLLKLKHSASDLVSFAIDDTRISGKIFGSPHLHNAGSDSDVSSTPSTKASVAIYPVHIKSSNTDKSYIMPTASVMSQATKNVGDNLDKMQTADECQNESVQDPPVEVEDTGSKEQNKELETKRNPVKRASKRLQTKLQKDQRKDDSNKEHDMGKSDSSEKSLPSAFNVSSRLAASKGKAVRKPLTNAAKSRKAIKEKVFSKGHSRSLVESEQKPKENYTKFHMVTPARRREPRSGAAQENRTKEDKDENKDESVDFVQDSLPLADSMEDGSDPNHQHKIKSNQGSSLKKRKVGKKGSEQNTESILESTANDNHRTHKTLKPKARQKTNVQATKSAGLKKDTANRRAPQNARAKQRQLMSPYHDDSELDISNYEYDGIYKRQDEALLKGNKRTTSNTIRRTSQSKKAKQQLVRAPVHDENEPDISNDESGHNQDNQDEPYLEGNKRTTSNTIRRTSQSKKAKQQLVRAPVHDENEPDISNDESGHNQDDQDEPYLEGSGYVTECYVKEPIPVLQSSTPVIKVKRPVSKEYSTKEDKMYNSKNRLSRELLHEHVLNTKGIMQTPKSGVESGEDSEEEDIPLKLWLSESISTVEAPRNDFQHSQGSGGSEQGDEKEETEEDFDSVHSESENEIQHGSDKRGSRVIYSVSRNDSGIGETPFVEELKKQTKLPSKRSSKQKPLQISITPITPTSEQSEQMEQDEDDTVDVEDKRQRRKRKFVEWSKSGPSRLYGSSVSGTRNAAHTKDWYKEPVQVNEAHLPSYRGQHHGKPRKLSYEDTSAPYNQQEPEEGMSDEEEIRREVQGLINLAGGEIIQAVRRKRRMIRSFFQKANDMMSSTIDSFWDETQTTSYSALEKHRSQFSEQVQVFGKQMDKTSSILEGMEETFNTVAKQFKILKSQRQVNEKRLKGLQHLQDFIETDLTSLERKRNEQEATLRTEMEKEMLKLQNKFLKDTRKQKEDELKMMLNTLWIP
ncbi:hypothetical protein ACROYT_G010961 [Oculina patagonica]